MKPLLIIILLVTFNVQYLTAQSPDSIKYQNVNADDFLTLLRFREDAILIDVRTPGEFRKEWIEHAKNIPYPNKIKKEGNKITKDKVLLLYCTTDVRSKWAAVKFYDMGFRSIYSLDGGINDWKRRGLPVAVRKHKKK
jgi:rhodanese-related sulfurtransferase